MGQTVDEFAIVGEQQQPGRIEVESADRQQAAGFREGFEDGAATFGIDACADLANRFVVHQCAGTSFGHVIETNGPAVNTDVVLYGSVIAQFGRLAVHGDMTCGDPGFDLAPRTEAEVGKQFLEPFRWSGLWWLS